MPPTVWINGGFVESPADASISAFDAGVQHSVGLFETLLACGPEGRVFRVEKHIERLARSAQELGLTESLQTRALAELVESVVARSELTGEDTDRRARVRLTVTGGDLNMLATSGRGPSDPTVMVHAQPATGYPAEMFEKGVSASIADAKANPLDPFTGHKTVNYWWRLRELQVASGKGAGEAIVLQVTNHVTGGAVSNLFAVMDGALVTPLAHGEEEPGAIHAPVLPGVTRGAIIECAERAGIGCDRRLVPIADVLDADEVFLTNSSWGVLPVVKIEAKPIAGGVPGPVTTKLRDALETLIREEP